MTIFSRHGPPEVKNCVGTKLMLIRVGLLGVKFLLLFCKIANSFGGLSSQDIRASKPILPTLDPVFQGRQTVMTIFRRHGSVGLVERMRVLFVRGPTAAAGP